MKTSFCKRLFNIPFVLVFTMLLAMTVMAESYTATTMRLLHYEGTVEIEDESGKSGLVMENIRFNSGQSLHTGAASSASVGMDSTKIVTLDENTKVKFTKKSKEMQLSLSEGSFFLDVSEKLGGDESLDIKTSTMTVGIRGTIVVVSTYPLEEYQNRLSEKAAGGQAAAEQAAEGQAAASQAAGAEGASLSSLEETILQTSEANGGVVSVIGVLEGKVQMDYRDETGKNIKLDVSAGQKATLLDSDDNSKADVTPEVNKVDFEDIFDAAHKEIQDSPELQKRLKDAGLDLPGTTDDLSSNPANGNWTYNGHVTVIAQSASKMYDGQPLTRRSDVLVQGLPSGFTFDAAAGGTRTDAGSGDNPVQNFAIYNRNGENVTSHFTNIEKISGRLTIDPAPLTTWSGSASKVYDGTPLTSTETKLTFSPGYEKTNYARKNLSYVVTGRGSASTGRSTSGNASGSSSGNTTGLADSQTLYGICGTVLVHGSNPLTEEIKEIYLAAGQKLTVHLSDKDQEASIEYVIETITEDQVPEDILRIYADNPEILAQACAETGWDTEKLNKRIQTLPPLDTRSSDVNGVKMDSQTTENLMEDCTNVRITIDTEGTNYNNRALNKEEAHYTPMKADPSIKIITNASITDVGTVPNSFTIDWGSANQNNYKLSEQPGTLTVTPASAVVKTGSAEKVYDGTPLTNSEASISGLVNGETATVTATGSITNVGSESNSYSIDWGSAKEKNYDVSSQTGTLRVTGNDTQISIKVSVSGKTYDGKHLDIDTVVTSEGSAETASKKQVAAAGSPAENETASKKPSKKQLVTAADSANDSGTGSKGGQDQTTNTVKVDGLPSGFTFKAHITGSRTDAGTGDLTIESYQILDEDGTDVTDQFSNVEIVESTLTIDPAPAVVTTSSASKLYDGTPLTSSEASVSGIVDADKDAVKVTATGSITEIGTTENTYTIDWGTAKSSNYTLSETIGTLEVTKNDTEITFTAPSDSKTYDGTPLQAGEVTVTGLPEGFTYTAAASGSQTDAGSSETAVDSYKILNADGNDVTAGFSNIKTVKGTLTIKALDVVFELNSYDTEFNGQKVLPDGIDGTYGDGSEVDEEYETMEVDEFDCPVHLTCAYRLTGGGEIQIDVDGYSDAGTYDYEPVKTFLAGTESNYNVSYTNTGFTISPLTVNLNVKDGSCVVDGGYHQAELIGASCGEETAILSSLGENEWRLAGYTIFPSEHIDVKMEDGGGLDAGTYPITYSYSFGNNDPGNYKINEPTVTKTVIEPLIFSLDLGGREITYDSIMHGGYLTVKYENGPSTGEEIMAYKENQTVSGIITNSYTLPIGGDLTIVAGNAGPDAGTYKLDCETTFNAGNSDNYKLNITGDELIINPRSVPLETGSAEETYDPANPDKPVTNSEAVIHNLAFDDQEAVTVTATGAQIEIGSSANTYSIDWGSVNPDNYIIVEHLGTLTKKAPTGGIDIIDDPMGHSEKSKDSKAGSSADTGSSADQDKDAADDGSKTGSDQTDDNSNKEEQTPAQPDNDSKKEEPKDQMPGQSDKDSEKEEPKDQTPDQSDNKSEKEDQTPDQPEKPENNSKNEEQKEQKEQASEQSGKSSEKNDSKAEQPKQSEASESDSPAVPQE